jgi:hypothetical protein
MTISRVARPPYTENNTNTEITQIFFHASSGIRTHDLSVLAAEEVSCFIPRVAIGGHLYGSLCSKYQAGIEIYEYCRRDPSR